jgi:predicted transcriptional regulator
MPVQYTDGGPKASAKNTGRSRFEQNTKSPLTGSANPGTESARLDNQIWFPRLPDGKGVLPMARPAARALTERELEVMHVFWAHGEMTAQGARDRLAGTGTDRAYTTIATLVRILQEKGFLQPTNGERPFRYVTSRSYEEVSGHLLGDMIKRVFRGSRSQLLIRMLDDRQLSLRERTILESLLEEKSRD